MTRATAAWAIGLAAALALPLVLSPFFIVLLIEIAVIALFSTAFNLLMGFGGMCRSARRLLLPRALRRGAPAQRPGGPCLALAAAPVVGRSALIFGSSSSG